MASRVLQNVGVAEAVSSGDLSETRQRETAAVQTLGDRLLGGDEDECYSSKECACVCLCLPSHDEC
jgi:hypothetical protein